MKKLALITIALLLSACAGPTKDTTTCPTCESSTVYLEADTHNKEMLCGYILEMQYGGMYQYLGESTFWDVTEQSMFELDVMLDGCDEAMEGYESTVLQRQEFIMENMTPPIEQLEPEPVVREYPEKE